MHTAECGLELSLHFPFESRKELFHECEAFARQFAPAYGRHALGQVAEEQLKFDAGRVIWPPSELAYQFGIDRFYNLGRHRRIDLLIVAASDDVEASDANCSQAIDFIRVIKNAPLQCLWDNPARHAVCANGLLHGGNEGLGKL